MQADRAAAEDELRVDLERRFGELRATAPKPFSSHYWDRAGKILVKIYRGIEPSARQQREIEALTDAPGLGINVPMPLACGQHDGMAWTALTVVPGESITLRTDADARAYARVVRSVTEPLRTWTASGAGSGWRGEPQRTSAFLEAQLSATLRRSAAWEPFEQSLRCLDGLPCVHLHGDLKPDHLILGDHGVYLVDWEACSRGPAVLDEVDVTFRVAREVVYAGLTVESPFEDMSGTEPHSAALSWRLALWLDRRHDLSEPRVQELLTETMSLTVGDDPWKATLRIVRRAHSLGTQY